MIILYKLVCESQLCFDYPSPVLTLPTDPFRLYSSSRQLSSHLQYVFDELRTFNGFLLCSPFCFLLLSCPLLLLPLPTLVFLQSNAPELPFFFVRGRSLMSVALQTKSYLLGLHGHRSQSFKPAKMSVSLSLLVQARLLPQLWEAPPGEQLSVWHQLLWRAYRASPLWVAAPSSARWWLQDCCRLCRPQVLRDEGEQLCWHLSS